MVLIVNSSHLALELDAIDAACPVTPPVYVILAVPPPAITGLTPDAEETFVAPVNPESSNE